MPSVRQRYRLLLSLAAAFLVGFLCWRLYFGKGSTPLTLETNSLGMEFVLISPGSFLMGSPDTEAGHERDESPVHEVSLTRGFFLSLREVTEEQYQRVMGIAPEQFLDVSRKADPRRAAEYVSHDEAKEFCRRLSELPEELQAGRRYRLPTEAEWEYACRAGTSTPFPSQALADVANNDKEFAPLTRGGANPLGLIDMQGGVREWCEDWYAVDYYANSPACDPTGPSAGTFRVARGGADGDPLDAGRAAARMALAPGVRQGNGLRVVLCCATSP